MARTKVLLTGASGSMGHQAFLELKTRRDQYDVKLIVRPSKVNKRMFAPHLKERDTSWLEIVWGDLTNPDDVRRAVSGVDYVLHPAAMISPAADRNPEAAHRINVGGMRHLIEAVHAEPDGAERIGFVSIGSVAQYGDRLPPLEYIKVGDPLKPSVHDYYALTKCEAERMIVESGIRRWTSMRQTFIVFPNLLTLLDPILFHQPIDQRIEIITSRDAGYGLVQTLEAQDDFWGHIYNMSGGPNCRVTYIDFLDRLFRIFGLGDYRRIFDRNWFALQNFHCGYYEDSPALDAHLGHFRDSLEDFYELVDREAATWMKLGATLAPTFVLRRLARRFADPLRWIEENNEPFVDAFFGSRKTWEQIPDWD